MYFAPLYWHSILYKRGKKPEWELKEFVTIYDDIQVVNKAFAKRLAQEPPERI